MSLILSDEGTSIPAYMHMGFWISVIWLLGICAVAFAIWGLLHKVYAPTGSKELQKRIADGGLGASMMQLITVALIVGTVEVLALEGKIKGEAAVAIFAAISGYILRGFGENKPRAEAAVALGGPATPTITEGTSSAVSAEPANTSGVQAS